MFKKIFSVILDFIEKIFPTLILLLIFFSFIIGVFSRYIFKTSLMWTQELSLYPYVWLVFLGACYCDRDHSNITFSILYDKSPIWLRKIFDGIGYIIILVVFGMMLPHLWGFYKYFMKRPTVTLKIPLGICYMPFAIFMLITGIRYLYRLISLILSFFHKEVSEK